MCPPKTRCFLLTWWQMLPLTQKWSSCVTGTVGLQPAVLEMQVVGMKVALH